MEIIYVSSYCSNTKFNKLFKISKIKPAQQAQKYHRLMVEGLVRNKDISIEVISALPLNRSMVDQPYFKSETENENGVRYMYLSFINMPILRHIGLFTTCFFTTLKWCLEAKKGLVICDVLDISVSTAAVLAARFTKTPNLGIVTDVPSLLAGMASKKIGFKRKVIVKTNTFVMDRFESYVFLTECMNDLINKKHKPYVVIEGQVDIDMADTINELSGKYEKKVCIYAGALQKIYGIKLLTDSFIAADVDNAELHIYGSGDFEEELKKICQEHTDIRYFGVVPNDIVVKEQIKASLLVNPRLTNEEYTKYSFPSKNMEYMVSGTPVLTTCLPGMPEVYKKYVYLIEDETVKGLTNTLKVLLSKTREELHQKGQEAKRFVLKSKNNVVQAGRILEMATGHQQRLVKGN